MTGNIALSRQVRAQTILEGLVILAALATIPLTILQERGASSPLITTLDWVVWSIFLVELSLQVFRWATRRESWKGYYWLSLAVVVPSFPLLPGLFELSRLARLARLGRLGIVLFRGLRGMQSALGQKGLRYVVALAAVLVVAGGYLIHLVEPTVAKSPGDGFWWAIVTITTVGYGDISPASPAGRFIAGALMLTGIGVVSTLAASVAAHFVKQEEGPDLNDIAARLERIERLLEERPPL